MREQFYRLDKRSAGFLSTDAYQSMLSVLQGGARHRWQHAKEMAMLEKRVLGALGAKAGASTGTEHRADLSLVKPSRAAASLV